MSQHYYEKEIEYLQQKNDGFIERMELRNYKTYNNKITNKIDEIMNGESNELNAKTLRFLTGNIESTCTKNS